MNQRVSEQLDKILALADSNHDGEALVAVRKARQMLSRDGLSFGDLARAASTQTYAKSSSMWSFLSGQRNHYEARIQHLLQQLDDLQAQMQTQDLQLGFWRRRAMELEQTSTHAQSEAERWKKLASETADRLWEIGRTVGMEEFAAKEAMPEAEKATAGKK
ncbi:MAG: hypothetical protein P4M13_06350 [Alphaproteobacteria bacterium]|nr:hypothetical protein [Alphaproteobacteria bacterium]